MTVVSMPSVLEAKLTPPQGREGLIERSALLSSLDALASKRLVLVSAPAGYGSIW